MKIVGRFTVTGDSKQATKEQSNDAMTVEEEEDVVKASFEGRHVLVGIRFDDQIRELLDWALFKVANPGDSVIALHICRNSGQFSFFFFFSFFNPFFPLKRIIKVVILIFPRFYFKGSNFFGWISG